MRSLIALRSWYRCSCQLPSRTITTAAATASDQRAGEPARRQQEPVHAPRLPGRRVGLGAGRVLCRPGGHITRPPSSPNRRGDPLMNAQPRLVVSAPSSGHGKTAIAVGLLAACAARGVPAAGFKVGPDHTDAAYLGSRGRPSGPQPGPAAGRRAAHRAAVRARRGRLAARGHRGRDGPVRLAHRAARDRRYGGGRRRPARAGRAGRRRGRDGAFDRGAGARVPDVRRDGASGRRHPEPGRLAAARADAAHGARRHRHAGAGRAAPRRPAERAAGPGARPGSGRAPDGRGEPRGTPARRGRRAAASTWTG